MRHRKAGTILGREKAGREALLRGLATSVMLYEKIRTTKAKAHAVQPLVERLITIGKTNGITTRRRLARTLYTDGAVKKVLEVLSPRYQARAGGYTRITKIGRRQGDAAEMAVLELV